MTDHHIGSFTRIDDFVADKLRAFDKAPADFRTLFELMFRERDNVMFERSRGYRVEKITYGEARRQIVCAASRLRGRLDLPPDSAVGLYMENGADWIVCFWAILAAGYRPLLLNKRLPDDLLQGALRDTGCAAVIAAERDFSLPVVRPEELTADQPGEPDVPEEPDVSFGTELLVMSSGTSRHLKICAYTARELRCQIHDSFAIIRRCPAIKRHVDGELKLLTFLPFYHVFGLIAVYIWFAFFSRTFVQLNDLSPQTVLNTIRRHRVTHIFAVPLFWETVHTQALKAIAERGEATDRRFHRALVLRQKLPGALGRVFAKAAFREVREGLFGESIRFMITGGSMIPRETLDFFNGIGYRLANGYGMTEIGITSVELSTRRRFLNGGFVGQPMTYARYALNEQGELLVQGDVMAAYTLCDGRRTDRPEWFNTHDLAVCEGGHYRLLGRRDDLIVGPNGENLNPHLLEPRLKAAEAREVCLIGQKEGEQTLPVLVVSVPGGLSADKRRALVEETGRLIRAASLEGTIGRVVYTGAPLLQPQDFKPDRLRLAEAVSSGGLPLCEMQADDPVANVDAVTRRVAELMAASLGKAEGDCPADADFFLDLGGTSLDYFALLDRLQQEFDVAFPAGEQSPHTLRELAQYVKRGSASL